MNLTRAAVVKKAKEQKAKFAAPSQTPSSNQPITSPSKPKSPSNPTAPIEIILDRDYRIHIFGLPADANPETIVAILRRALDKMKVELASTV